MGKEIKYVYCKKCGSVKHTLRLGYCDVCYITTYKELIKDKINEKI